jgi:hypothetical protein
MARRRGEPKTARASARGEDKRQQRGEDTRPQSSVDRGEVPTGIRSTMSNVEALSVGAVNILAGTVVSALRGIQEIGGELGSTAVVAFRGSIRAAEEIGGDLGRVAKGMMNGAVTAGREVSRDVGRLASNAADGAMDAADRIASATTRAVRGVVDEVAARRNGTVRKPPQRAVRRRTRSKREQQAA